MTTPYLTPEYERLIQLHQKLTGALTEIRKQMAELGPTMPGFDYRIALRPDVRGEDPMEHNTILDDIVVRDVPMFRAEQMDTNNWWVCCFLDNDTHDRICWSVTARIRPTRIEWVTTEFPDAATYEHEGRKA